MGEPRSDYRAPLRHVSREASSLPVVRFGFAPPPIISVQLPGIGGDNGAHDGDDEPPSMNLTLLTSVRRR